MKIISLIFLMLILITDFAQGQSQSSSVYNIISNTNPNFGPDILRYKQSKKINNNDLKLTRIDSISGDSTIQKYDSNGNLTYQKSIGKWGRCYLFKYEYNELGKIIKEVSLDCDGKITYSMSKSYSDSTIIEAENSLKKSKVIYHIDSNGHVIKRQDVFNGRITTFWLKEYSKNGNVVDFKFFWSDSLTFHEVYEFGDHNQLLKSQVLVYPYGLPQVYDTFGRPMVSFSNENKRVFKYNEPNNMIKEYRISSNNDTTVFNYTYDQYGNLKMMKKIEDGKSNIITENKYQHDELGNIIRKETYFEGRLRFVKKTRYEY